MVKRVPTKEGEGGHKVRPYAQEWGWPLCPRNGAGQTESAPPTPRNGDGRCARGTAQGRPKVRPLRPGMGMAAVHEERRRADRKSAPYAQEWGWPLCTRNGAGQTESPPPTPRNGDGRCARGTGQGRPKVRPLRPGMGTAAVVGVD